MPRSYSRAIDVVARPDVLVCGAGWRGSARPWRRRAPGHGRWSSIGWGSRAASSRPSSVRPSTASPTREPGCRRSAVWSSRCSERMGVLKGRDPRATSFTDNGEDAGAWRTAPDWLVPRCDPERFKKAADEILNDGGVEPSSTRRCPTWSPRRPDRGRDGQQQGGSGSDRAQAGDRLHGRRRRGGLGGRAVRAPRAIQPMSLHFRVINVLADAGTARERAPGAGSGARGRAGSQTTAAVAWPSFAPNEIYFNAVRVPRQQHRCRTTGRASSSRGGRTPGRCSRSSRTAARVQGRVLLPDRTGGGRAGERGGIAGRVRPV